MDLERGTMRSWVVGGDGVKRWTDNGAPAIPGPDCDRSDCERPDREARTDRPHSMK